MTTNEDTSPRAGLDLDEVVAKWRRIGTLEVVRDEDGELALDDGEYGIVARMDCDDPGFVEAAEVLAGASRDVRDLAAEVRALRRGSAEVVRIAREALARAEAAERERDALRATITKALLEGNGFGDEEPEALVDLMRAHRERAAKEEVQGAALASSLRQRLAATRTERDVLAAAARAYLAARDHAAAATTAEGVSADDALAAMRAEESAAEALRRAAGL